VPTSPRQVPTSPRPVPTSPRPTPAPPGDCDLPGDYRWRINCVRRQIPYATDEEAERALRQCRWDFVRAVRMLSSHSPPAARPLSGSGLPSLYPPAVHAPLPSIP
jgi:hypothetical protein